MQYVWAFVIGGGFCVLGQLLIDFTKLTPARVLVCFVVAGVVLTLLILANRVLSRSISRILTVRRLLCGMAVEDLPPSPKVIVDTWE